MTRSRTTAGQSIEVAIPGRRPILIGHAVFDFNGTLALDGVVLPGVRARLDALAKRLSVTILSADTFGTAESALRGLRATLRRVRTGADKAKLIAPWRRAGVAAIGNGRNDVSMFRAAAVAIAVLGPEGLSSTALAAAMVVVPDVGAAIDLLLEPARLVATLRP